MSDDVFPRPRKRPQDEPSGDTSRGGAAQGLYAARLVKAYGRFQAGNYAAGLAFKAFMSMFPLLLGILAILGIVISDSATRASVQHALLGFFPSDSRGALTATLDGVRRNAGILGVVGIVGTIWGGSSLFTSMEWALGEMLGYEQRAFVRQRLMALSMTLAFAVAVVGSVFVNAAVSLLGGVSFVGPVVGAAVWTAFMFTIYRVVPNRRDQVSGIWPGALLAGLLMEILSLLWPLYTGLTHGFNTYGSTFALFFLLATWLYFLSQFILLGAVANRLRMGEPAAG